MRAYSYLRFSTIEQSKGDSARRQLEASEKYAADHGLELDTSLTLHDLGISAFDKTNITKGQLGAFIRAVEDKRVPLGSYLLVESLDRLSRAQVMDALQQFITILNLGIVIVTISDDQIYSKASVGNNFTQLIMSIVLMARAHEESVMKSKRIGAAWQKKLESALSGKKEKKLLTTSIPKWMTIKNGKIVLIPERVKVIGRIFELVKDGLSMASISRALNKEGIEGWTESKRWSATYINQMTRSTALYGAFSTKDKVGDVGYYPAAMTKEEYDQLRYLIGTRNNGNIDQRGIKRGKTVSNLFSGLLHCGYCGCGASIWYTRRNGKPYHSYYACKGRRNGITECRAPYWRVDEFETLFFMSINQIDMKTIMGKSRDEAINKLESQRVTLLNQIEKLKSQIDNLTDAIAETPVKSLIAKLVDMEIEYEKLQTEYAKTDHELNAARGSTQSTGHLKGVIELFHLLKNETDEDVKRQKREMIFDMVRKTVTGIKLYTGGPSATDQELRYADVTFKSGKTRQISEG